MGVIAKKQKQLIHWSSNNPQVMTPNFFPEQGPSDIITI